MITTTLRSEWIKLRSARSLFVLQIMTAIVTIGISYLHCRGYRVAADDDPTQISLFGLSLGVFFAGVIGVLSVTSEFASGTIGPTLSATPRRGRVALAKILLLALMGLIGGTLISLTSFEVGLAALAPNSLRPSLADPTTLRAVIGGGLALAAISLLGLGLGFILHRTAAALVALVVVLYLLPLFTTSLASTTRQSVLRFLPADLFGAMLQGPHHVATTPATLGPWTAIAVLATEVSVILACGVNVLGRTDL